MKDLISQGLQKLGLDSTCAPTMSLPEGFELASLNSSQRHDSNSSNQRSPDYRENPLPSSTGSNQGDERGNRIWNGTSSLYEYEQWTMSSHPRAHQQRFLLAAATVMLAFFTLFFSTQNHRACTHAETYSNNPNDGYREAIQRWTLNISVFDSADSPQSQALRWLEKHSDDLSKERMLTRYALAVFFFSDNETTWWGEHSLLSEQHECEWHNVVWETGEGVYCDEHDVVVALNMSKLFEAHIPDELLFLTGLRLFSVRSSILRGTLPEVLSGLQHLALSYIRGDFEPSLSNILQWKNLQDLELRSVGSSKVGSPGIVGTVPESITAPLTSLRLTENRLWGTFPFSSFQTNGNGKLLRTLELQSNSFSGAVPWDIVTAALPSLETLNLDGSGLAVGSTLPTQGLESMRDLDLSNSVLTGSFPTLVAAMSKLTSLSLRSNPALIGTLPTFLGTLTTLERLDLSWNALHGPIPSELGRMTNLLRMNLGHNQLSGQVPSELASLPNLVVMEIHDNQLTGDFEYFCDHEPCNDDESWCAGDDWWDDDGSWDVRDHGVVFTVHSNCMNQFECSCCQACDL